MFNIKIIIFTSRNSFITCPSLLHTATRSISDCWKIHRSSSVNEILLLLLNYAKKLSANIASIFFKEAFCNAGQIWEKKKLISMYCGKGSICSLHLYCVFVAWAFSKVQFYLGVVKCSYGGKRSCSQHLQDLLENTEQSPVRCWRSWRYRWSFVEVRIWALSEKIVAWTEKPSLKCEWQSRAASCSSSRTCTVTHWAVPAAESGPRFIRLNPVILFSCSYVSLSIIEL